MSPKDDACSRKLALLRGTLTSSPERASGSSRTLRPAPRKPKRTSFPCLACGKTFPTQQAMAGHCSIHARDRLNSQLLPAGLAVEPASHPSRGLQHRMADVGSHHGRPGVQGPSATNSVPTAVVPYPSYLPFVHLHPMSNQVVTAPSCLDLRGPNIAPQPVDVTVTYTAAAFRTAGHHVQAAHAASQHGWGTFFPFYTLLPMPCNATTGPAPSHAWSANQPGLAQVDLTLQVGGPGDGNGAQKRTTLLPLLQDGRQGRRAVVVDGGDPGGNEGKGTEGLCFSDMSRLWIESVVYLLKLVMVPNDFV